jgi:YfiH family protein
VADRAVIEPDWPAPPDVLALCTTRLGGRSRPPYDSFNLAHHVGDEPARVAANRALLLRHLPQGSAIQWLSQVHGTSVVEARGEAACPRADGVWSRQPGQACAVLTADCLPVLFCSERGDVVAAAHAGWRGLCAGVLEATIDSMGESPDRLLAWLGPAIGPGAFEVGPEVRDQFLAAGAGDRGVGDCFAPSPRTAGHYLADLYALARRRLAASGLVRVHGGGACTFTDTVRFYSYRRDGETGRMVSLIMLKPR